MNKLDSHKRVRLILPKAEQCCLELWRKRVLYLIDQRVSLFQLPHEFTVHKKTALSHKVASEHRALRIPELLDAIIGMAGGLEAQLTAFHISHTWRQSAKSLIGSRHGHSFWEPYSCAPVEYGQRIDPSNMEWLSPSQDEIKHLRK